LEHQDLLLVVDGLLVVAVVVVMPQTQIMLVEFQEQLLVEQVVVEDLFHKQMVLLVLAELVKMV
tara:strand:+ start:124 stop:315 length:192 start_codon:yes stop_codon:yes gene_type:complete